MKKALTILAALMITGVAQAEIVYPVDVNNSRWAVYDSDTGEIIHRNRVWPNITGEPIQGLAPNIVYLLHIDDARPEYDSRVYFLVGTETVDVPSNEIRKTWATPRRVTEEIVTAIHNREIEELEKQGIDVQRELIRTRLAVSALIKHSVDKQALPPKIREYLNKYSARGTKIWKNRDRAVVLEGKAEAGEDLNLDEGWEAPEND